MPNIYIERLNKSMESAKTNLSDEKEFASLKSVAKPSVIDSIWKLNAEDIESMHPSDMEKYMYALAQYAIFIQVHINQIRVGYNTCKRIYKSSLVEKALEIKSSGEVKSKTDTMSFWESIASIDPEIKEVELRMLDLENRLALYDNIPDQIIEKLNTLKKIYTTKTDGRLKKHEL